jgi:hypothetical protein
MQTRHTYATLMLAEGSAHRLAPEANGASERQEFVDRIVESEPAFFDQDHRSRRG